MKHKFVQIAIAAAAVVAALPSQAATYSLGDLSAVSPVSQTRSFDVLYLGSFTDYYTFSVTAPSNVTGTVSETDGYINLGWTLKIKDLEVTSLALQQLTGANTYSSVTTDMSPEVFNFSTLGSGSYRLVVNGSVMPTIGYSPSATSNQGVSSYTLTASASASTTPPVAAPVPELSDLAMTALGLTGVAFWARRQRAKA